VFDAPAEPPKAGGAKKWHHRPNNTGSGATGNVRGAVEKLRGVVNNVRGGLNVRSG